LCRDIYLAAPLHDVGKVAIPDHVLLKPGRLNNDEMAVIRTHAAIGGRILADSHCELIQLGATIAGNHHERWDGSGYPSGLKQQEIPIAARIVAVADVFDALTTKRPYKEAMPPQAARDYLEAKREREFDPGCVDAFLARWDEVLEICTAQKVTPAPSLQPELATARILADADRAFN
jgi:putative two-component system response regulator